MVDLGFVQGSESDHEYVWKSKSLLLELHKCLIPSYNKDYYAYFGDGWGKAVLCEGSKYRYEMSKEDQFVYLFCHVKFLRRFFFDDSTIRTACQVST